ncbi:MAG: hypothetical protein U0105_01220 [Candidatus Obscuribacterales bacterium]
MYYKAGMGAAYSPRNFDGQYLGPITIRKGLRFRATPVRST